MATKKIPSPTPPDTPGASAYVLRIELRDVKPAIWREVWVDPAITLRQLHAIIQAAMGWENAHLYGFAIPGSGRAGRFWGVSPQQRFEPRQPAGMDMGFDEPAHDDAGTRLAQVLQAPKDKLLYLYDFGDDWEHVITLKKIITTPEPLPLLADAAETCPPEDCGGVHGFADLVEVLDDPQHPEHAEMSEYYEGLEPGPLDQAGLDALTQAVAALRPRPRLKRVR
ncbi:MAG TPA: plasmid pRiA4b ORF-3 family protein [Alicycliphilus sp.]|nr:plasmid pRiA4b ORF-3 family protein [Alicycliphilus sp.]